jgi:hypothetical protein
VGDAFLTPRCVFVCFEVDAGEVEEVWRLGNGLDLLVGGFTPVAGAADEVVL